MLKKTRIALAAAVWVGITILLTGFGHEWLGWLAKLQFLPSVLKLTAGALGLNLAVVIGLILLTLLVGRVYCSVICPLGITQDIITWIHQKTDKKFKFSYKPEKKIVRYVVWATFIICLIAGLQVVVALIAPYSAYGRIVRSIAGPYSWQPILVGAVTFIVVAVLAWTSGREWCNSICPVGTTLSFLSRFAIFRPMIDADACIGCHKCERECKAQCIDIKTKTIDASRCVDCFNCIDTCPKGSLKLRFAYGSKPAPKAETKEENGRRAFIQGAAIAMGTAALAEASAAAQEMKLDGGLADVLPKQKPERTERLVPFGARSIKDFYSKCTACQLCVSACPNGVLRPSTDLKHFMQPEMSYENGFCRPECTKCSEVCPAGAILPVTPEEKAASHIGTAVVDYDLCIVNRDEVSCGNCSRHCPAEAIVMVHKDPSDKKSPLIPSVIEDKCIGCGACEFLCPSRPLSAIHVNGLKTHIKD